MPERRLTTPAEVAHFVHPCSSVLSMKNETNAPMHMDAADLVLSAHYIEVSPR